SDLDQAEVPLGLAELLGLSCVTLAQKVEVKDGVVLVERVLTDGHEVVQAPLPCVVTVSNELGQPRYPTLRGIMAASRKQPQTWSLADLGLSAQDLVPTVELLELFVPTTQKTCEFVKGENEEDAGRNLALKLREAKLI
ncbi:MAG: electron transfer flavoprotein subunit beta/FixA family protein, partial [Chloroflexi bacterium]|nr:electron transfer flavoprotein subunit beta/FixA family protein [Chloroflexota bacterium]